MTVDGATRPTIHDLQTLARSAAQPRRRRRPVGASRAARLHLIDALSRWGSAGLALIAGLAVFIAVSAGQTYPLRAAIWAAIMLAALSVCRRLRNEFRAGERSAARPFRWRANYTAALTVVGAGFGAGSVILAPGAAAAGASLQPLILILLGALGAGALHAAHGRSAAALFLPAALFALLGAWRIGGAPLAVFGVGAWIAAGCAGLFLLSRTLRHRAMRRFPRTGLIRRAAGAGRDDDVSEEAGVAAAL